MAKGSIASRAHHLVVSGGTVLLPIGIGLAVGIGFVIIVAMMFPLSKFNSPRDTGVMLSIVRIPEGAATGGNFEPAIIKVVIGTNNTVRWVNEDTLPYTVASDTDYNDPISGPFDMQVRPPEQGGPFMMPGKYYEYIFTKVGVYGYHSIPHPQMKGTVVVYPRNWLTSGYVPTEPIKYEFQAVESVENYLRERVNNFVEITLYSSLPSLPSNHSRYLNASDFFRLGGHLPLRYYPPDASDSFYSIDPVELKVTGKCVDIGCVPFNPENQAKLRGKLVYVLDSAWVYKRSNGELENLPDGFFVDAYTGDTVVTTFHCPEQKQEWCR